MQQSFVIRKSRHRWISAEAPGPAIVDLARCHRYLAKEMGDLAPLPSLPAVSQTRPRTGSSEFASLAPPLRDYFESLFAAFGPQHWWPGRTPFEVIVGAILTQNTSWTNVERAIENLRCERLLTPRAIEKTSLARLARLIRSSGYFRQKARKLKAFVRYLRRDHQGSLAKMFRTSTAALRVELLGVHGIGPETADSILLYAGQHPIFVVDAYTRRMLERHQLAGSKHSYDEIRQLFEHNLPRDVPLYNEFHALIVRIGKDYCRASNPRCEACPLRRFLPERMPAAS